MKNKIQKFSKGDFRLVRPDVVFEETNLVLIIGEGEVYRGSFRIRSTNDVKVRGLVYPSSFRVQFKDQGFDGNPAKVEFTYDGRGLRPGYVEQGFFSVVCTGGEYRLSFTAIIEKPYLMTTYGKIQNTDDFKKLAIKDYSEAVRLFRSRSFYEILKYENERILHLYDNIRKWSLGEQAMEEFLVGIKQKECIFLTLAGEGMLFEDIHESTKSMISIMKNTWGFMPIDVEAVGSFIKVLRPKISTDDFIGNGYEVEYLIRPEFLHGGRNYGKIRFVTPYETLEYEVEVLQNVENHTDHHYADRIFAQITKDYIHYEAGRITKAQWVAGSVERVEALRRADAMNELYQLFQVHVYLVGERLEEAKWVLENFNYNRFAISKDPLINCYYLYLTALVRNKPAHTSRVLDEIGDAYLRHQDSWPILHMMLRLDRRYQNPMKRLEVLEQQFSFNCHEALFYLAAFRCYEEKPVLLKKLGNFEIQVLNFAVKYKLISKEISLYVANLASQKKEFLPAVFRILTGIYDMYPESMILNTIVTMLIRGGKNEDKYFVWYQRAVNSELKIAKLYESFMQTLDLDAVRGPLPKSVFLYFLHGNSLNYRKTAFLYANLLTYEVGGEDLFLEYREQMVRFTWEQLEKRHITESLRILYRRFCVPEEMDEKRMEAMRDVCYSYSVNTKVPRMKYVRVIEKDGSVSQKVPYEPDGATIIRLYTKESRIVWESMSGRFYTDSISYETKRLFYEPRFLELYQKYEEAEGRLSGVTQENPISFELLKERGVEAFSEKDVFRFCSRQVRDGNYAEDDFLTWLCFYLYTKEQYDKATLTYLAEYYCGATEDMRNLWKTLKDYDIPSHKVGERIITQMVFSEDLFCEEPVFEDYYLSGHSYFRLKQAYLAYASRLYLNDGRALGRVVFDVIVRECEQGEDLADVCKIALLKYFSEHDYPADYEGTLHDVMQQMCEKQIVFPYYLNYKESWLREMELYDKSMICYHAKPGSTIRLFDKLRRGGREGLGYHGEPLLPVFGDVYVKEYVLYEDEEVSYYFQETCGKEVYETPRRILNNHGAIKAGRYGKINEMIGMSPGRQHRAMREFLEEETLASEIYTTLA